MNLLNAFFQSRRCLVPDCDVKALKKDPFCERHSKIKHECAIDHKLGKIYYCASLGCWNKFPAREDRIKCDDCVNKCNHHVDYYFIRNTLKEFMIAKCRYCRTVYDPDYYREKVLPQQIARRLDL